MNTESLFSKYATMERGIGSTTLWDYQSAVNAYINPTVIEERRQNVAQMDVANIITAQVLFLESVEPSAEISLYINTPGGKVSSGLAIYDTMQLVRPAVSTICTGMAASMGSILLCAGEKGKRKALPHSKVLIHQPLGGTQGQASDILIAAKEIEKTRSELVSIISQHCGTPYEKVFADVDRDYWMTAEEAKAYGMVDEILTKRN